MRTKKLEKIFRINPIEKIWNYIKEHKDNLTKQGKNKNTINFEERKRKILKKENVLNHQNENTEKSKYYLTPEELYRMEQARVRRSERFRQLNEGRSTIIDYSTKRRDEQKNKILVKDKREEPKVNNRTLYSSVADKKEMTERKTQEERAMVDTRTKQKSSPIVKYNKDFVSMQEAYHKTCDRRETNEKVINYEKRREEITNTKKTTIIDFKQRYAVGSNEFYHYNVGRSEERKDRNRVKEMEL